MYKKVKRVCDILFSLIGLIVFSPLLVLTAIAIKIESKGPIIFKQERLGLDGQIFKIYKFRSMCVGAEKQGVYECKGDLRVTKIGKIIRKLSIDEFPQFMNILKGDMSVIGPRPTLTYHPWPLEEYTEKQKKRFDVRPGVTGLAQIKGRKGLLWEERIEYDQAYVENLSFILDIKIFVITLFKVITMQDNVNIGETTQKSKMDL